MRKLSAKVSGESSDDSDHDAVDETTIKAVREVIAASYMVGGAVAALISLSAIGNSTLGALSAVLWLLMLAQIAAALYGGWHCWRARPIGMQVLYWLSWSCVPALVSPLLVYSCAIGFGITPTIAMAPGYFETDITFQIGYSSHLRLAPGGSGVLIGANLVALAFVAALHKLLERSGVSAWPLQLPNSLRAPVGDEIR